eukprot:3316901-Amphidinium_carterae.1
MGKCNCHLIEFQRIGKLLVIVFVSTVELRVSVVELGGGNLAGSWEVFDSLLPEPDYHSKKNSHTETIAVLTI